MSHWFRKSVEALRKGGTGSGNFGHAGRPGEVGGSSSEGGGGSSGDKPKKLRDDPRGPEYGYAETHPAWGDSPSVGGTAHEGQPRAFLGEEDRHVVDTYQKYGAIEEDDLPQIRGLASTILADNQSSNMPEALKTAAMSFGDEYDSLHEEMAAAYHRMTSAKLGSPQYNHAYSEVEGYRGDLKQVSDDFMGAVLPYLDRKNNPSVS